MQQVSDSVVDILKHKGYYYIPYIDDLAGADIDPHKANAAFICCSEVLAELGLKEAIKKQSSPACIMTWLGMQFDSRKCTS